MKKTYRTCQHCGTVNLNRDYCENCGKIINITLERKLKREQKTVEKQKVDKLERPNRITLFFERVKDHDNLIIRYVARFFYSVWIIVIAIGSFLALLFGYIAA
ncbi:hypothetical protein [Costertonia aggregata]|uniref:Uncharacterized protein n=1 Tax=Costertonia aggregata TaxID=343403 RepID=A0A7H9AU15_9FLAO|nr:hypothetical protein [Costertonia aggregata]QLG46916.1 hypothetical protein HYG79_16665 [Costertonia aggregata]